MEDRRIPHIMKNILPRRGIIEIICNSPHDEILCLVAPYGSGKTSSVIYWLSTYHKEFIWISLNSCDNERSYFWARMAEAVLSFSDNPVIIEEILRIPIFNENPYSFFKGVLSHLLTTVHDRVMVIDNFAGINDPVLLSELKAFLGEIRNDWRVVILSRNEIPPIFNDFILKKKLRLITTNDLSFSMDEIGEFFLMNGKTIEQNELMRIYEETAGWPIAINAILAVQHGENIVYDEIARDRVMSLLEDEIWVPLSVDMKKFLLKTSVLDKLTPSICQYVTDIEETHLILRNLCASGFFITSIGINDTYCYHRVFKDFLLNKLVCSGIDVSLLYIRAGWWLYERNESVSALISFCQAKNMYGINMSLMKIRPADVGIENYIEAALPLTAIDINNLKAYPHIAAEIALLHFIIGNISEMQRIYEIILKWYECGDLPIPPDGYIDLYWELGWLRYVNPNEDILFNSEFNDWMNIMDYAPHLVEIDLSRAQTLRMPSLLRGVRDYGYNIERFAEFYIANIKFGFIKDVLILILFDLIIAEIAYEREEFDKAEAILREIIPKIEKLKNVDVYFSAICLLVKILRAVHNHKEIEELIYRAKTLILNSRHFSQLPNFHAFELRNRLSDNIPGVTDIFRRENYAYKDKSYYYLIYRHITYVRALLSESKYVEAIVILINLESLCNRYKRCLDLAEVYILRSVAEFGVKNTEDACRYMEMAIGNLRACGFIRLFADDAAILYPILCLIHKDEQDAYIQKIFISCKKALLHSDASLPPMTF